MSNYFLSPRAISSLHRQKKWSIAQFGYDRTKKYFLDMNEKLQYLSDNYRKIPNRNDLTGDYGLCLYTVLKHYVVFIPLDDGIYIADILGKMQDIPNILQENFSVFQRELMNFKK